MRVRVVGEDDFGKVFMTLERDGQGGAEEAEEWVRREVGRDVLFVPQVCSAGFVSQDRLGGMALEAAARQCGED